MKSSFLKNTLDFKKTEHSCQPNYLWRGQSIQWGSNRRRQRVESPLLPLGFHISVRDTTSLSEMFLNKCVKGSWLQNLAFPFHNKRGHFTKTPIKNEAQLGNVRVCALIVPKELGQTMLVLLSDFAPVLDSNTILVFKFWYSSCFVWLITSVIKM